MKTLNLGQNKRIPMLMNMMRELGRASDPDELLDVILKTRRQAYDSQCLVQLSTRGLPPGAYRIHRIITPEGAELVDFRAMRDVSAQPVHRGGIFAEATALGEPKIFHYLHLEDDPALGDQLAGYQSLMAVPLAGRELPLDWFILLDRSPDAFDERDLEEMILRANLVCTVVNNLETARKLARANQRIEHEMDQIARLQKALLPERLPEIPGLRIAASYKTFDLAGGDLYDFKALDASEAADCRESERWAILIGDVSGHGPAAAVVMAMFHGILHAYPSRPAGPAEVLRHANVHLCAKRFDHSFITAFLAFYEPATRKLTYSRAGHNPPILKQFPHSDDPTFLDEPGDLPLGIISDVDYREASIVLRPGQTLILYTDGVVDAVRRGGEVFGLDGIVRSLITCTGEPDCAIDHINQALLEHQDGVRPADDQTIVALQVT